jgi:hypothetical protein
LIDDAFAAGNHGLDRLERETSSENCETVQNRALGFGEQLVAPVERRAERLVPRQRGAAAAGQETKPIIKACRELSQSKRVDPAGGEFDCECNAVEPAANIGNDRRVGVGQLKSVKHRGSPFDKELDGRKSQGFLGFEPDRRRWNAERQQAIKPFAGRAQRLPAGGQNVHAGRCLPYALDQIGNGVHNVLAAVKHQEHFLVGQESDQRCQGVFGMRRQAQYSRDHAGDKARIGERGQIDKGDLIAVVRHHGIRYCDRDRRLADAACADNGDEAPLGQLDREGSDNLRPPDHAGQQKR